MPGNHQQYRRQKSFCFKSLRLLLEQAFEQDSRFHFLAHGKVRITTRTYLPFPHPVFLLPILSPFLLHCSYLLQKQRCFDSGILRTPRGISSGK
jgi:hypothetical protein